MLLSLKICDAFLITRGKDGFQLLFGEEFQIRRGPAQIKLSETVSNPYEKKKTYADSNALIALHECSILVLPL